MIDLTGKSVLVVGAGISGIGSATLLEEKGALPILYDGNEKLRNCTREITGGKSRRDCTWGFSKGACTAYFTGCIKSRSTHRSGLCSVS